MGSSESIPTYKCHTQTIQTILKKCPKELLDIDNFLDQIPLASNYTVLKTENNIQQDGVFRDYVENKLTFEDHIKINNITDQCHLELNQQQYDKLCFFHDYYSQQQLDN
jgi:hypothetical protein